MSNSPFLHRLITFQREMNGAGIEADRFCLLITHMDIGHLTTLNIIAAASKADAVHR